MAKFVLHNDESIFDFVLLGISSQENQYVVVSNINECLGVELSLNRLLPMILKNKELFEFSQYFFTDETHGLEYILIPNKSNNRSTPNEEKTRDLFSDFEQKFDETALLIPELPQTNYFLLIKGERATTYQLSIFEILKKTQGIRQVHEIIPEKLQSRNNLVF